jgi:hypothetical protein
MDSVVLLWLLGTIIVDLQETTRGRVRTAQQLWVALEEQFLYNREVRALHLDTVSALRTGQSERQRLLSQDEVDG